MESFVQRIPYYSVEPKKILQLLHSNLRKQLPIIDKMNCIINMENGANVELVHMRVASQV